ncbi:integrator complex subunit 15-like isoform X1 [Branchiostoma floridae x Branchiostoma japonicum]
MKMPSLRDSLAYEGFPQATRRVLEHVEASCSGGEAGTNLGALVEEFVHFRPPDALPHHTGLNALQELQLLQILSDYFGAKTNVGLARQVFMVLFGTRGGADRLTDHKVKLLGKLVSMCIATQHEMVLDCTAYWILQEGASSPPVLTLLTSIIQDYCMLMPGTLDTLQRVDKTSPSFACQFVTIVTSLYQLKPDAASSSHPPPSLLEVIAEWVAGNPRICLASLKDTKGTVPVTPIPGLCHWCIKSPLVRNPESTQEDAMIYSKLHLGVLQSLLTAQHVALNTKLLPVSAVEEMVSDLRTLVQTSGGQGEATQLAVERLAQVMQVAMATGSTQLNRKHVAGLYGQLPENGLLSLILSYGGES